MGWKDAPIVGQAGGAVAPRAVPTGWREAPKLPPVQPHEEVGAGEHFTNRFYNSILGGKPVMDILATAGIQAGKALGVGRSDIQFTDEQKERMKAAGLWRPEFEQSTIPGPIDTYRQVRDFRNHRTELGDKQQPEVGTLATIASIPSNIALGSYLKYPAMAAPAAIANLGRYGPAAARLLAGIGTGTAYGTAYALTNGKADLTRGELGQAVNDIAGTEGIQRAKEEWSKGNKTAAFMSLLGAGAPGGAVGGGVTSSAVEALAPLAKPLNKSAINQGRRVLTNGADSLSTRAEVPAAAVTEALESGAIKPLGTTGGAFERLTDLSGKQGELYSKLVSDLKARGVQGPKVRELADELFAEYEKRYFASGANKAVPSQYLNEAANLEEISRGKPTLDLDVAEETKRQLYRDAKYGRVDETPLNEAKRDIASRLKGANEQAIESAAAAPGADPEVVRLASEFRPTKTRLGNLIEARDAAARGNARVGQRSGGVMPGPLETGMAIASGQPGVLVAKPAINFLKTRGTSTYASAAYSLAKALREGTASPAMVRYMSQNRAPMMSYVDDSVGLFADEGREDPGAYALAEILRRR